LDALVPLVPRRTLSSSARTTRALTAGYVGLAALDTWLAGSASVRSRRLRRLTKPLLMPTLAASLVTDPAARWSPLRPTTLTAQAAGWGGDVLLLGEGTTAFTAGAGSFGLGHAAYIQGMRSQRDRRSRLRRSRAGRVALGLFLLGGPAMALGAAREEKALGPAVLGYTALLSTMLAHSQHLSPALPARARRLTAAGAALFVASDTLLGTKEFWWKGAPARAESVVMATYTAGQLLLSKGAAAAG
jgi:uncharacterized membrane protein YhhN